VYLFQHAEAADRRREIEFWTRVAHECASIGNLNSAMAVVAAFDAISHQKLTKTVSLQKIFFKKTYNYFVNFYWLHIMG